MTESYDHLQGTPLDPKDHPSTKLPEPSVQGKDTREDLWNATPRGDIWNTRGPMSVDKS